MKAALFFEDNQLCHLGENIGKKAIKVSTITTEDDKVVSIKNSEVKNRNMNYFIHISKATILKFSKNEGTAQKVAFFKYLQTISLC